MPVIRVDVKSRRIFIHEEGADQNSDQIVGAVTLRDCEFGAGMIRGEIVETFAHPVGNARGMKRAFYNPNKVSRYIDKETGKILVDAKAVMVSGTSVFYVEG